jgi:outer membrane protein
MKKPSSPQSSMRLRCMLVWLLLGGAFASQAQEYLNLDKAIELALENSNLVKITKKQKEVAATNYTVGNAGYMPTVSLNAGNNFASNTVRQELFNGTIIERNGAQVNNWNGNIAMNWVLFDGFRRNNMYQRLRATYAKADAQTKLDIENLISKVCVAYFDFMRQVEITKAYENNLALYQDRLRLAEAKQANGLASKSDVLLSKVDINSQLSILLRQKANVETTLITLNQVLNRESSAPVNVVLEERKPSTDTSFISFSGKATALLVTEKDIELSNRIYKENNSSFLPKLSVGAAYNFAQTQSQAGQLLLNRSLGPNVGFVLSWSIFDGFNKNRISKSNNLQLDISRLQHEENKRIQTAGFDKSLAQYKTALKILSFETESYQMATESNEIAKERYQAGRINLFEYKETQRALEDSKVRLANARYDALAAEVELKRLNGELVK